MQNQLRLEILSNDYFKNHKYSNEIATKNYTFIEANTFQKLQEKSNFFNICQKDMMDSINRWNILDIDQLMLEKRQNTQNGKTRAVSLDKILETEFMFQMFLDINLFENNNIYHNLRIILINSIEKNEIRLPDVLVITFKKGLV